ncbi:halocyanin domain-containing protein [Halorubrum lacusprofundi]|jgi:halocyanin-like protein|uniref:Halocyanin domain protein n=1 Tax=Halorubrum lacusprofundi (strain ATCC 49239 / DSM 5036 / JCM 8891 / ACAM 34) TaxID=416348 RepID=B9LN12_HALLT|nr:halocyanin domain-containing protein [Halorubrum lacusprofundi]ACM56750.1 halocyanin domain protein [Halorubrum lacusprofundi ATCC 49239]MCG1007769.1 halocyanin domain-containing protein [Halorubrum lacusprofundi]
MTRRTLDRRTFVQTTAAVGATVALAGCGGSSGDGSDGSSDGSDGSDGSDDGSDGSDGGSDGSDGGSGGGGTLSEEPNYDGFFDDVSNYDGTVDMRDADEVTVNVGANDGLSFGPAAVAVSSGTTVVWEWTGQGGDHNVSATDGEFESDTAGEEGHTFEHTFEEAGTYTYVCTPHEAVGMKGAVYVE